MNTATTDEVIYVPLSKLRVSAKNVRKKGALSIPVLAALIRSEGLLQNLIATRGPNGTFDIVDGKRRFLALQELSKELLLDLDREVPVKVIDAERATSASLAAAFSQLPLHPVDQFEAFKALVDEGLTIAEIAARFGVDERAIQQRLKLASLATPILEAYREEAISLDALQAYTVSDDKERQLDVFQAMRGRHFYSEASRIDEIRKRLTEKDVPDTDPRVRLVGREAYEAAGGAIRSDFFSETAYFTDTAILDRLAAEKVAELKERVEAEGWKWVDVKYSGFQSWDYQKRSPKIAPTTPAQDAELAGIKKKQDAIGKDMQKLRRSEPEEADQAAFNAWNTKWQELQDAHSALSTRCNEIEAERTSWGKKTLSECGAVITLQDDRLIVHRGLLDKKTAKKLEQVKQKAAKEKAAKAQGSVIPDSLYRNLTAHRSAVIRQSLMRRHNQRIALAVLLHSIIPGTISTMRSIHTTTCMEGYDATDDHVQAGVDAGLFGPLATTALAAEELRRDLPPDSDALLSYLLEQSEQALLEMVAVCVSSSFGVIHSANSYDADEGRKVADLLVDHLEIDMGEYWRPTADNYFNHVSKELVVAAVTEAKGPAAGNSLQTMSKTDAALAAQHHMETEEWLPEIFRKHEKPKAAPATKSSATKKRPAKVPAAVPSAPQEISHEEAVAHIQHLLDAKKAGATAKKAAVRKVPAKKAAAKNATPKKAVKKTVAKA